MAAGVREDSHLPPGPDPDRGGAGAGGLLHHPLRGHLRGHRHEGTELLRAPAGGGEISICLFVPPRSIIMSDPDEGQRDGVRECDHVLQGAGEL